jgi:hypothetical protein
MASAVMATQAAMRSSVRLIDRYAAASRCVR